MTDSRGCEHEGTKVETASNRLNGVADPEGATALGIEEPPIGDVIDEESPQFWAALDRRIAQIQLLIDESPIIDNPLGLIDIAPRVDLPLGDLPRLGALR